ncbi:MAG: hypothetical protein WCO94_01860 [Verrucomicrobiota bacterium]
MFRSTRSVVPEILDTLDACDPEALRSRRDLRWLDWFLGGSGWIVRSVLERRELAEQGVVELGAGEGRLCAQLAALLNRRAVTGLDFMARPADLNTGVGWRTGDIFQILPEIEGGIVVGSLILHHFSSEELARLGEQFDRFQLVLFSEPLRSPWSLRLSRLAHPFVGRVTRHDMPVSIRAGFQPGELAGLLGLDKATWKVSEVSRLSGVLQFKAWRD